MLKLYSLSNSPYRPLVQLKVIASVNVAILGQMDCTKDLLYRQLRCGIALLIRAVVASLHFYMRYGSSSYYNKYVSHLMEIMDWNNIEWCKISEFKNTQYICNILFLKGRPFRWCKKIDQIISNLFNHSPIISLTRDNCWLCNSVITIFNLFWTCANFYEVLISCD